MTGEDYNLSWVCSYHLVCGEEIGDLIIGRLPSASNQLAILTDGTCLNALVVTNFTAFRQEMISFILVSPILKAELFQ